MFPSKKRLDNTYKNAKIIDFDDDSKFVLFSDCHRGDNSFAENYCSQNGISYVYITDITRQGLINRALVASDGLHPSELAYSKFVEKTLPLAIEKL